MGQGNLGTHFVILQSRFPPGPSVQTYQVSSDRSVAPCFLIPNTSEGILRSSLSVTCQSTTKSLPSFVTLAHNFEPEASLATRFLPSFSRFSFNRFSKSALKSLSTINSVVFCFAPMLGDCVFLPDADS